MKMNKKRLMLLTLSSVLFLTACKNANTQSRSNLKGEVYESNYEYDGDENTRLDTMFDFKNKLDIDVGDNVLYDYYINNDNTTEYAKLIDERELDSEDLVDGSTFIYNGFYNTPEDLNYEYTEDDKYLLWEYKIYCKKFLSEQGDLYYYVNEQVDTTGSYYKKRDDAFHPSISSHVVYKYDDGELNEIARGQLGTYPDNHDAYIQGDPYHMFNEIYPEKKKVKIKKYILF